MIKAFRAADPRRARSIVSEWGKDEETKCAGFSTADWRHGARTR